MKTYESIFFGTYIKMIAIIKETCESNDLELIIDDNGIPLWLNEKHIEKNLDHKTLPVIKRKYHLSDYRKHIFELVD